MKIKHEELANLVEVELSEEDQILEFWNEYYPEEREQAFKDITEYAKKRFRVIIGKKRYVERLTGYRLHIKIPRTIIKLREEL